jgi:hypothetical protein
MIDLDDPRWEGLEGGYRVPYDPRLCGLWKLIRTKTTSGVGLSERLECSHGFCSRRSSFGRGCQPSQDSAAGRRPRPRALQPARAAFPELRAVSGRLRRGNGCGAARSCNERDVVRFAHR